MKSGWKAFSDKLMWRNFLPQAEMSKHKRDVKLQFRISKLTPQQLTSLHSLNYSVVTGCIVKSRELPG